MQLRLNAMTTMMQQHQSLWLQQPAALPGAGSYYKTAATEEQQAEASLELSGNELCSDLSDSESDETQSVATDIALDSGSSSTATGSKPQFARELLVFYLFGKIQPKHGMLAFHNSHTDSSR